MICMVLELAMVNSVAHGANAGECSPESKSVGHVTNQNGFSVEP